MKKKQNMVRMSLFAIVLALIANAGLHDAFAQSQISPVNKWSWGENTGWTNWYDNGVTSGAEISMNGQVLSGFIWNENYGWLYLGDGSPDFGPSYSNTTAADTGVNITPSAGVSFLTGYAWGEQIGWVNFGPYPIPAAQRPRILRGCPNWIFAGFAWGENVGWINMSTTPFSSLTTNPADPMLRGDINFDGLRNGLDVQGFTRVLISGSANLNEVNAADMNGNFAAEIGDVPGFVDCLLNGNCLCP